MPALSFQEEWLLKLLNGTKQQTTRPQTDRIKVGDIVHVYNQQRRKITDKTLRRLTADGCKMVHNRIGGEYPKYGAHYHAHFLGKVEITEVYDIRPFEMSSKDIEAWALDDGFKSFGPSIWHDQDAYTWFASRYGDNWGMNRYTVIRWNGWQERYFEPGE